MFLQRDLKQKLYNIKVELKNELTLLKLKKIKNYLVSILLSITWK